MLLILRLLKCSLKTELKNFHKDVFGLDKVVNWVSASALCKARQKIHFQLFADLSGEIVRQFYHNTSCRRWFHYRLMAVDGTEINLPASDELRDTFGHHHTNSIGTEIPQARVSFLYDVLNKLTVDAQMESFRTGEQQMLMSHLKYLGEKDLLTADANYGHFWVFKQIIGVKADFCIRMNHSSNFVKQFLASGKKDSVLLWEPSPKTIENCAQHQVDVNPLTIRLVRVELPNGKTEVLAVSLTDQDQYTYDNIIELYNQRWDVEESFKKFMQRLLIEFFSSIKENGVRQDFYANIFMMNVVATLAEPVIDEVARKGKRSKHIHQVNWTSALGDIRPRLVLFFLRGVDECHRIIKSIWASLKLNTCPVRPDRIFPRDKRKKGSRKKALINYKPSF